jgi:hypothetical protein
MANDSARHPTGQLPDSEDTENTAGESTEQSRKHIVIAVVVAAVLVSAARLLTDYFVSPRAVPIAAAPATPAIDNAQQDAQIAAEARKARQLREQELIEQDRLRREQKKAEVMRARDAEVAASQAEDAAKEAAWQRFFTPAKKCDTATDDAARVECSNQYIRARERFDKLYAEGKLH